MDSASSQQGGNRGKGKSVEPAAPFPRDRVRAALFAEGSKKRLSDCVTPGGGTGPSVHLPNEGVGGRTRRSADVEGQHRMGNERSPFGRRYTSEDFAEMMKACPQGEEDTLRGLCFEGLIHEGMTNVFRVRTGFKFDCIKLEDVFQQNILMYLVI